jgi:hypothetical protein
MHHILLPHNIKSVTLYSTTSLAQIFKCRPNLFYNFTKYPCSCDIFIFVMSLNTTILQTIFVYVYYTHMTFLLFVYMYIDYGSLIHFVSVLIITNYSFCIFYYL